MAACAYCLGITPDDPRFADLDSFIATAKGTPGSLISVLHRAQQVFGFLPKEVQLHIAIRMEIPPSEVYGVVTFYNFFNTEPVGQYPISVCMGTACYVRGADKVLEALKQELGIQPGEVSPDGVFSLEVCRCLGACGLAPVITVAGEMHGKLTDQSTRQLLAQLRQEAGVAAEHERANEVVAVGSERR